MFTKLIIATDLSPASTEVVSGAAALSLLGTKEILLLQCIRTLDATSAAISETEVKIKKMLEEEEAVLKQQGFKTSSEVVFGSIHQEVNRIAKERDYQAIVIGSHGQTLAKDIFLGSVASEIIQSAHKPVLVVRVEATDDEKGDQVCKLSENCRDFRTSVLFPTDFSLNADKAFPYVEKIVESGAESVTLLHVQDMVYFEESKKQELEQVNEIDRKRLEDLSQRLKNISENVDIKIQLAHGKPSIEILKKAQSISPSLIIMGSQGKGYVKELFLGSVSHTVCRQANTSVLLVPFEEKDDGGEK